MLTSRTIDNRDEWNALLIAFPRNHILQTWEWGEFKRTTTGWQPERFALYQEQDLIGLVAIGTRRVGPFTVMYAPKGPLVANAEGAHWPMVLGWLETLARSRRALWLKIDPEIVLAHGPVASADAATAAALVETDEGQAAITGLQRAGWRPSQEQVQFRSTMQIDLRPDEDALLMALSGNARRKVRTAEKRGVTVRPAGPSDLQTMYDLYAVTGARDQFLIRPFDYYRAAWERFMADGLAHALIAEVEGEPVAHVILYHFGDTCWYFYGASGDAHRDRMPNYLLQWEAMRWARQMGHTTYDLWGAPDVLQESDPLWGVYQFKRGFRGQLVRHIGAWDYAPNALLYRAYAELWPKLRRTLGRAQRLLR
jgi:peptidoglycan pentaglycine glycine transferase (the first glycine)